MEIALSAVAFEGDAPDNLESRGDASGFPAGLQPKAVVVTSRTMKLLSITNSLKKTGQHPQDAGRHNMLLEGQLRKYAVHPSHHLGPPGAAAPRYGVG